MDSRVQGRKRHNGEPWAPNKKPSSVSQQHRDKALSKSEARASRFLANFAAITAELRSLDAGEQYHVQEENK